MASAKIQKSSQYFLKHGVDSVTIYIIITCNYRAFYTFSLTLNEYSAVKYDYKANEAYKAIKSFLIFGSIIFLAPNMTLQKRIFTYILLL